ncbi:MAG TPA: tetratricopeptide repeat protein [Candidatus Polarisedimenticolaceae bacterium]|nr:tetratricopeptide repeat protein [Candidatus Polarisedimenticolaceae bacterium]
MPRSPVLMGLLLVAGIASAAQAPSLEELRAAVVRDPADENAHRELAIALHDAHRIDEAIAEFEWLARRSPTERSLLDLALAYGSGSRWDDAEATYRRILETSPNHAIVLHNLGNTAWRRGDPETAIEYYVKAIKAKPDYLLAHARLGDALTQAERYRDAYRAYESVLELEPQTAAEADAYYDALYHMAALDLQMGAHERAGMMLAELIRADPDHPKAYYAYGQVLMFMGREEDAQKAFAEHQRIQANQAPSSTAAHGD